MSMNFIKKKLKEWQINPVSVICWVILLLYSFMFIYLFIWGGMTSFKGILEFSKDPLSIPEEWHFENYKTAFDYFYVRLSGINEYVYLEQMALYSIIYAGGCAFMQTLATCIVAYATARFDFKLSKIIYATVLVLMVLPIIGALPSEIQLTKNLGLYDTLFGPLILKFNFIGMYYLVFYATFRGVSKAYTEAAKIDGASNMRIMTQIIFPLIKNTFLTIMLINFVAYWNDYQTPMVYIPSYPTMAYGLYLYNFSTISAISDTPMKIAGCMIVFLPILIVFIVFQKRLMGNISMGGVKE